MFGIINNNQNDPQRRCYPCFNPSCNGGRIYPILFPLHRGS